MTSTFERRCNQLHTCAIHLAVSNSSAILVNFSSPASDLDLSSSPGLAAAGHWRRRTICWPDVICVRQAICHRQPLRRAGQPTTAVNPRRLTAAHDAPRVIRENTSDDRARQDVAGM